MLHANAAVRAPQHLSLGSDPARSRERGAEISGLENLRSVPWSVEYISAKQGKRRWVLFATEG